MTYIDYGLQIKFSVQPSRAPANKNLFAGGHPENKNLFAGGPPANKNLFAGGPPANKKLFTGGPPANKKLFAGGPPANKTLFAGALSNLYSPEWPCTVLSSLLLYCMVLYGL